MPTEPRIRPSFDMAAFAERLRTVRGQRKLTQGRTAELAGVSLRMYCRWEAGEAMPYADTLIKIADALQVSADELLGREDLRPESRIHNHELHRLYQHVDQLGDEDQQALIILLDSLVKRAQVKRVMQADMATTPRRTPREARSPARTSSR
jgi:transcriptional regulator with XRE-family HTH domain